MGPGSSVIKSSNVRENHLLLRENEAHGCGKDTGDLEGVERAMGDAETLGKILAEKKGGRERFLPEVWNKVRREVGGLLCCLRTYALGPAHMGTDLGLLGSWVPLAARSVPKCSGGEPWSTRNSLAKLRS